MTPLACAAPTAWQMLSNTPSHFADPCPSSFSSADSVRPRMSFITRYGRPSGRVPVWWTAGMPGCCNWAVIRASSANRLAAGESGSASRTFTATSRSKAVSRARKTAPMPPRPTSPSRSNPGGDGKGGVATAIIVAPGACRNYGRGANVCRGAESAPV